MDLKERARKLKKDLPAVFLAMKDRRTPFAARFCAALAVVYPLSPIDLIPDFIPVLGALDDILLIPLMIMVAVKMIPEDVWEQCRQASEGMWQEGDLIY